MGFRRPVPDADDRGCPPSAATRCVSCSMDCASWRAPGCNGGTCRMTCRPGRRSTSRCGAGWPRAASKRWCTTCARHCGLPTTAPTPTAVVLDSRTLRGTPESGARAGYDGHKRKRGSKVHLAVDTLGQLLALCVTPANAQDRAQVAVLAEAVQAATGESVEIAFVDQGYTGQTPATEAAAHGIRLEVVALPEAKRGFVLLPRRWVVERSFAWASRFRRLARDYER